MGRRREGKIIYETDLSTVEVAPQTAAWIFVPQLFQEWAEGIGQPPPGGAEAFDAGISPKGEAGMKTAASQGLPRERRLRRTGEFARLRQQGRRLVCGCLIVNWQPAPEGNPSRLGVVTSRALGSAVVRSRGRRLMREVWRRHQGDLRHPVSMVLVARPSLAGKTFGQVEADFLQALRLARLLKEM